MDPFSRYLPSIEAEMRDLVRSHADGPEHLYNMLRYHLGWMDASFRAIDLDAGKRLRPVLLLLSNEAHGGDWRPALPAAAAVELLHNFSLIHDDIEDQDELRRGRPTLWRLWEIPQALNAGDALFAISYRGMLALEERGTPPHRVTLALRQYTEAVIRITEGQHRDIGFETDGHVEEARYLAMIGGKTAALVGLATELGAILAGAGEEAALAQRAFGEGLGKAFQMHDDLLGLWGDPAKTGKPVGSDLQRHKKTLPILYAVGKSERFRRLFAEPVLSPAQVREALQELDRCGGRAYTEQRAHDYHRDALTALERSGASGEAYEALQALAEQLLGRQK
ncbi:MAG: polyprenyl synthetase family protein [Anaerolineae bacterium]|nr:polyprenyl synthetase family protein [Anaerolineae bacterium]